MRASLIFATCCYLIGSTTAFIAPSSRFAVPSSRLSDRRQFSQPHMVDLSAIDVIATSSIHLAETEPWVQPAATALDIFLNFMSFSMLSRVVLSWYPSANVKQFPWIFVVIPTEPLLRAVKGIIPPAFGVDITPVFWLGLFTFVHEILLGQQGLFTMKMKYGI